MLLYVQLYIRGDSAIAFDLRPEVQTIEKMKMKRENKFRNLQNEKLMSKFIAN